MATELPPGTTIPPDGTLPEGITLPPGLSLPPGVTIPPALLDGSFNGTVTEAAEGFLNGGNDIFGNNAGPLEADFDFTRAVNATPYFNAEKLVEYEKNPSTAAMAGVPRFSHTSDFSYLAYVGTQDRHQDGQDYIAGLMFTGLFLLVFFLIWACVLIVFKMRLNGFLSGQPFLNPWLDDPSEQKRKRELEEDGEVYIEDPNWKKQPFRVRVTFFIAGLLNIVFAMLMVTKGVANLQQTTDTVQMSTSNLDLILNAAVSTVDNVKEAGITGEKIRAQVVVDLDRNEFCPDNPLFAQTPQGQNLFNATDGVIEAMQQMGAFIDDDTAGLEEGLEDAKKQLTNVDDYIINIEENEWLGGLIAFPYLILSALMMAGALAAQLNTMTDCFLCVLNWVILPLFMFVTFATFIFLVLISFAASMNADFCGGENSTPDKVIMDFMFRSGEDPEGFLYQIVRYYANQCTENAQTDPFVFLRGFSGSLDQGRAMLQNFTNSFDDQTMDNLSLACNRDFRPLVRSLAQMVGVLDSLLQSSSRAVNLLSCERVVPVYTTIFYDATCKYSITGFTWLFSCLLIVSAMGMIMIMFRSSYQNTIYERSPILMDESSGGGGSDRRGSIRSKKSKSGRSLV